MKIGVIGYGSIGKRHVANLLSLGYKDIFLLRETGCGNEYGLKEFRNYHDFLKIEFDFIIVSNPTVFHFKYLKDIILRNINVLIEKPIVYSLSEIMECKKYIENYLGIGMVAYNTRFHPCVIKVQSMLKNNLIGNPLYARFFIGQYLPDWRPNTNYSISVSAKRNLGGGVASELIHELDLAINFFGVPKGDVHSILTKVSDLQIETEDVADYLYLSEIGTVVSIHNDYLYRGYKRSFEIIGSESNLDCDLFLARINVSGNCNKIIEKYEFPNFERNDMYLSMIKYYVDCVKNNKPPISSLSDGLRSIKIVEESKIKNKIY